jgi:hypothetical protein
MLGQRKPFALASAIHGAGKKHPDMQEFMIGIGTRKDSGHLAAKNDLAVEFKG